MPKKNNKRDDAARSERGQFNMRRNPAYQQNLKKVLARHKGVENETRAVRIAIKLLAEMEKDDFTDLRV